MKVAEGVNWGTRRRGYVCVSVMLCQQLPQFPAATCLGEMPVGAQPSADRQLLIFHALLIYPRVKCYPLYLWHWAAALWHTQVVVRFQGCCDGQNLASPGHAA